MRRSISTTRFKTLVHLELRAPFTSCDEVDAFFSDEIDALGGGPAGDNFTVQGQKWGRLSGASAGTC